MMDMRYAELDDGMVVHIGQGLLYMRRRYLEHLAIMKEEGRWRSNWRRPVTTS